MCGIAGWIDYYNDISDENVIISRMAKALKRRGPDEEGVYKSSEAILVHRRLVVIDPENGKQPMTTSTNFGDYSIVYNGELYNTYELRSELKAHGYTFSGHSDTEVLLKAFVHFGESCPEKLNGIFSFAVWNSRDQELFIARDRIGVKPLFFHEYNGGFIFGSEIKALLCNPKIRPIIDRDGLSEVFLLGPGRSPGNGIIKGVKELQAGECGVFSRECGLKIRKYWGVRAEEFTDTIDIAIEKTRFLVCDAIERQLVCDVPLCCFLSGGLDSSVIAKVAADYYKSTNRGKLSTYSVDYLDNQKYFTKSIFQPNSDKEYIDIMVNSIGSEHHTVTLDNELLATALDSALLARDLPGMGDIDSSLLLFCKHVKENFTVALSGECSDEIFGGYPWYHDEKILFTDGFPWARSLDVRKSILRKGLFENPDEYVHQRYLDTVNSTPGLESDSPMMARMREMFMLNIRWFMQTLLDRKDRMSMYNGLEVRVPFCDYRIVEYAFNMPWEIKSLNGREKGILRQAMSGILPEDIIHRKKSPYPKTHNPIYTQAVSNRVLSILDSGAYWVSEFLDRDGVLNIINDPQSLVSPWYGQLMGAPQILAYIIQLDCWFREYNIGVEL